MTGFAKFLVGTAGASLLAFGTHYASGVDYIDGLEAKGQAALTEGGFDGVSLTMQRDPLARAALLDGVDDPAKRAEIEAALAAKGITRVRWAGDGDAGAGTDGAADGASQEAVANCQSDVNTIMEGKTINFRSGSSYMGATSLGLIDTIAETLKACDGMSVAVGGHTDATGTAEVNQTLSQDRADRVAAALAERGIDASRITATGFGSTQPKVEGAGANGANRRIEFVLSSAGSATVSEGEE